MKHFVFIVRYICVSQRKEEVKEKPKSVAKVKKAVMPEAKPEEGKVCVIDV